MKKLIPVFLMALFACVNPVENNTDHGANKQLIKEGPWLFSLETKDVMIPFNAEFRHSADGPQLVIHNSDEEILVNDIRMLKDSIYIQMPLYHSYFQGRLISDSVIQGKWVNLNKGPDYQIPFSALHNKKDRFTVKNDNAHDFSGKWEVTFSPDSTESCKAVGVFYQDGQRINGTFLTETGDYRYLEGVVDGNSLLLSTFDGSHAFLFRAEMNEDEALMGDFWSGSHWHEKWQAKRNSSFELTHPDSLTFAKKESDLKGLHFLDENSNDFALDDARFNNKVLIVQIMGTWCPNCIDESKEFAQLYDRYKDRGLEIVAVSYEKTDDIDVAFKHIKRLKAHAGINYPFVFGGKAKKSSVSKDFHMLNKVISYPTAIFVDRTGSIRKVHTGFYGPGTGEYYLKFQKNLIDFVELLLGEPSS